MAGIRSTLQHPRTRKSESPVPRSAEILASAQPASRTDEVFAYARKLYEQSAGWVTFYREIFGHGGMVSRVFTTPVELDEFRLSDICFRIHEMLAELRNQTKDNAGREEPLRVITIRIPKSLHESLRDEAYACRTSMNKLCISKLIQLIPETLVPRDV